MSQNYTRQGQPEQGEGHVSLLPYNFSYVTQGNWNYFISTSYPTYTVLYNVTNAQNDQVDFYIWLSKGTYTLVLYGSTATSYAISTCLLDAVSIGTLDWYNGSTVDGVLKSIASIAVTTSGRHTLSFKAATRNGSNSTGWYLVINTIAMYRTA